MTVENLVSPISEDVTVGQVVAERPGRSRVFENHGIDYCCGGKKTLAAVCEKKGIAFDDLKAELEAVDGAAEDLSDPNAMTLSDLIDDILQKHHHYLRQEVPRLGNMLSKVAKVHGENAPYMQDVDRVFGNFRAELDSHMMKEECILFPAIRALEKDDKSAQFPFGSLSCPINTMEAEHEIAGDAMEAFSTLTNGYSPPEWACNTFRAALDGLAELEQNMHQHVHKENNILFPKALKLEAQRGQS
ncbi:MAG: iron-sulfur cluster repair di-iron protein [Candidatus Hydrogenedentes bacterium]|nr:iron-sulfur cluster repair di-iron protein [Candidatus Hydrogenedentota bacterium]